MCNFTSALFSFTPKFVSIIPGFILGGPCDYVYVLSTHHLISLFLKQKHALFPWCQHFSEYIHLCFVPFHMGIVYPFGGRFVLGHFVIIFISSGGLPSMFLVELQCAYCGCLYFSHSHPWAEQTFSGQLALTGIFHCRGSAQSSKLVGRLMVWSVQEIHQALPLPALDCLQWKCVLQL